MHGRSWFGRSRPLTEDTGDILVVGDEDGERIGIVGDWVQSTESWVANRDARRILAELMNDEDTVEDDAVA